LTIAAWLRSVNDHGEFMAKAHTIARSLWLVLLLAGAVVPQEGCSPAQPISDGQLGEVTAAIVNGTSDAVGRYRAVG
jgi:hypothetical protein